jgi:endonuclease YncB( thermonuclease family)
VTPLVAVLAGAFACAAPSFYDGDNIRCGSGKAMRLAAIDAPEWESSPKCRRRAAGTVCSDALARASRDHLRALASRGPVRCRVVDASPRTAGFQSTDRYGRPIVRCFIAGVGDLGTAQLRAGKAVPWG